MPLPTTGTAETKWIPEAHEAAYRGYVEHDAWYSGDPTKIAIVQASMVYTPTPRGRHWAKDLNEERRVMLHVPVAGDIAGYSADLLFSEAPKLIVPGANDNKASSDVKKTQNRLDIIINRGGIHNRLVEAAETCAALGGVFIKPAWDTEVADFPILSVAQADTAVPEFKWGFLTAVTFWKEVYNDGEVVWRLLERHERGKIYNGLYKGSRNLLGIAVGLGAHPMTADLEPEITLPFDMLGVRYIPNMRPNRTNRGSAFGQSDYAGSEGLMDALDEVYTSWMRDIRLGQGRLVVPESWLEFQNGKPAFDVDKELFTSLDVDPMSAEKMGLTISQFKIRTDEHRTTAIELLERIVSGAGYSPQSFGLKTEGRAESGTALNIRERKSFITQGKKQRYWKDSVEDVVEMMMIIDKEVFRSGITIERPSIEFGDSIQQDVASISTSIELLRRATVLSVETGVRMLHPDWTKEQVLAEVERINKEQGMTVPDPIQTGIV